jgi:uncharacterized protein (DUF2252 family)
MTEMTHPSEERGVAPHPTVEERAARGRAARSGCPRAAHAALDLAPDRDPLAILQAQTVGRIPELVPIRYGRMLVSPLAFYRGVAAVMAHDLGRMRHTDLRAQLCGDAHLGNFGGYASPERTLVFDINDFDETFPGPFEWDVKRLATSFEIAGRDRGFPTPQRRKAVLRSIAAYRTAMREFAAMGELDVWHAQLDVAALAQRLRTQEQTRLERMQARAHARTSMKAFVQLTEVVDGERRIASDPPLVVPLRELAEGSGTPAGELARRLHASFRIYRHSLSDERRHLLEQFRLVDIARKVVGVSSVGLRTYVLLLLGHDNDDPLFLQIKEARASVLESHLGGKPFEHHGQRVVAGQRLMQRTSDILLGWSTVQEVDTPLAVPRDFYVRQLWDWKLALDLDAASSKGLELYADACGWTLARAHARSGDRIAIGAYLGRSDTFDRAVAEFAVAYADRNERDFEAVRAAVRDGRIVSREGV